ncbi:MAG: signal peptide peptidase SppA, partial [Prevotellaceae bacterium]|nr:signal peptide peptidase SppA [Prevotellaceae bacterium]
MKDFAKYVLATIVGIFATMIISGILMLMSVVGMIASGEATQSTPKNSVMVLNLSGIIDEQGQENVFGKLTGGAVNQIGLNDVLTAIKKAKDNDNIKGIYIEAGALQTGYATALEIRQALADFKKSKKFIVSYADNYTQGAYYIA